MHALYALQDTLNHLFYQYINDLSVSEGNLRNFFYFLLLIHFSY